MTVQKYIIWYTRLPNIPFSVSIIRHLLLRLSVLLGNYVQKMAETYTAVRD